MQYISWYRSPLGEILLAADEVGLIGLWFAGQKYFARGLKARHEERESPVLEQAKAWLESYFAGREPDIRVPLHLLGTDFQRAIWDILLSIPYGQRMTYGQIARRFAERNGKSAAWAQAVGGAVSRNPVSVIVPCHRVVGADGGLTGYAGGIQKKMALLGLESLGEKALANYGRSDIIELESAEKAGQRGEDGQCRAKSRKR